RGAALVPGRRLQRSVSPVPRHPGRGGGQTLPPADTRRIPANRTAISRHRTGAIGASAAAPFRRRDSRQDVTTRLLLFDEGAAAFRNLARELLFDLRRIVFDLILESQAEPRA